ncbi:flavodoxin [Helicobacter sp. MIT 14-3879]|uniref:flavodoxin n=1 Tax=Helicobacter sp. MIT 14-3879 TaxID=2040649 RepID=UPI000E1F49EE|nr:flavodoxin [Helicobacter sp. MIT 14-3879]RDU62458.1 flavodoxin [Helicobacter sp. MIT 14-3879]
MEKIGIFYGSTTGKTQEIAENIASKLQNCDLIDVAKASKDDISKYTNLILASSTYGDGDLQTDWEDFANNINEDDFINKIVAIVGLGDQDGYSDTFCDSIGILANLAKKATIIGKTKNENYEFSQSKSISGDEFLGLAIDEDNQSDLTESRIDLWINNIKEKFK